MPLPDRLRDRVFAWVADDPEQETAAEALALVAAGDEAGLADRFDRGLEFGTAGLRGVLGCGPNRMNRAVVRRATAGLCDYLARTVPGARDKGLVIGRDARRRSDVFARDAAAVADSLGFVVHMFEDPCPTPLAAFAVRDLGAAAGAVVTASHNPPEYNGFKVYWANGAQIIPPHDTGIAAAIDAVGSVKEIEAPDAERPPWLRPPSRLRPVLPGTEQRYLDALLAMDFGLPLDRELGVAYTPLHGVGLKLATRVLEVAGFRNVHVVAEQAQPDGAFPTVRFPNPEEPAAMERVLALAERTRAELILANDPDADRLAVGYRERDGRYRLLTGNEIGVLLGHHRLVDDPRPPANRLVCTTIVSSPLLPEICRALGVRCETTLTGFKWIANRGMEVEAKTGATFVFGYEEAFGSTATGLVRDKDGVSAALVMARLAAHLRTKGQTLGDRLDEIARRHGAWVSGQHNAAFPGAAGMAQMKAIMQALRDAPPARIGPAAVTGMRDYLRQVATAGGRSEPLELPPSDVLAFDLEGGARVVARPSGTEPKIKYYFDVCEPVAQGEPLDAPRRRAAERLEALRAAFVELTAKVA